MSIGGQTIEISSRDKGNIGPALERALFAAGYPGLSWKYSNGEPLMDAAGNPVFEQKYADPSRIGYVAAFLTMFLMMIYVTMVYGPIAAFLVELFPPKVRYTSLSFPYHIGNGIFGGMLPLLATAIVHATGNVYAGLWYPVSVAALTCIVGALFLRDRRCEEV